MGKNHLLYSMLDLPINKHDSYKKMTSFLCNHVVSLLQYDVHKAKQNSIDEKKKCFEDTETMFTIQTNIFSAKKLEWMFSNVCRGFVLFSFSFFSTKKADWRLFVMISLLFLQLQIASSKMGPNFKFESLSFVKYDEFNVFWSQIWLVFCAGVNGEPLYQRSSSNSGPIALRQVLDSGNVHL